MQLTRRSFLAGAGSLALINPLDAAAAGAHSIGGPAFGATWRAVLPEGSDIRSLRASLQAVVASVDAAMSPFRSDSEIARFNNSNATKWFAMSAPTCEVVAQALHAAGVSAGAFDPTVGGIVGKFGFGPISRGSRGDHSGISAGVSAVRKALPDLTLDLCGIAKGHALDRMAAAVAAHGVESFLIEVGGEVTARGRHPQGRSWQVGIERPVAGEPTVQRVVALTGEALATSGDRVNSYVAGGRRYGHIIDPHDRRPADSGLASVSVLAPTGIWADAMATALYAMGREAGPDFAGRRGLSALFLVREGDGIREIMAGSFADRVFA